MSVQLGKLIGRRRGFALLAALTILGMLVAGCAPIAPAPAAPAAEEAAPAAPKEKVALRFVVMDYDENMRSDTQALVDEFNGMQDGIEVTLDVLSWADGEQTLMTQVSAGQAPDLANASAQFAGAIASIGEAMPLDDLLGEDFLANFQPSGINAFTIDGELIAMPYFLDPRAMYYRKDLFEAAGLNPPETWDDVMAAVETLNNPPEIYAYGMAFSFLSDAMDYWWYAWLGANGADGYTDLWDENGKSRFNVPEAVEATQFLVDIVQKYEAANPDYVTASRDADLQPLFYSGKLAMLQTGSWFPTLLDNNAPDLDVGIAPIPVKEAGMTPVTVFWPDSVTLFKQTEHPEEAAEFLKFVFNAENRLAFAKQRGVIPERIDVGTDPAYAVSDIEKFFVEQLGTARNTYATPYPDTLFKVLREVEILVGRAVAGEITAEEAMQKAAEFTDMTNGQ